MLNSVYETQENKFNFVKGLIRISKCDGYISEEEVSFMKSVAIGMGLIEENIQLLQNAAEYDLSSDLGKEFFALEFETKYQSVFFLREAVQLCYIDGLYHEHEKNEIQKITEELGISLTTLKAIEDWVADGMKWRERGNALLDLE